MNIVVNWKPVEIAEQVTVGSFLAAREVNPDRVVVELNRSILTRNEFDTRIIPAEAEIEIVSFVGGGYHA